MPSPVYPMDDTKSAGDPGFVDDINQAYTNINDLDTRVTATDAGIAAALALKADLASPALTGNPTAPTASPGDNDTSIATTAFVTAADVALGETKQPLNANLTTIAGLTATTDNIIQSVGSAWASRTPAQVKTALALNNLDNTSDANKPVSTAQQTALNLKADLASPALTGNPTAPTQSAGNNSTRVATTAYVDTADALLIPKSIIDAKGDLIAGTANDTSAKLTAGSNGAMLLADSAQSTGLKWSTSLTFEGSGSPEGVVTASIGSGYRDTTNGAWYVKVTGAGNTGWGVISTAAAVGAWTAVSFTNSWADFGSTFQTAQYRKNGDEVQVRGAIKSGTSGAAAFTLPSGFRPPADTSFLVSAGAGGQTYWVRVNTDGTVVPTLASGTGTNAFVDITVIRFSITS